VRPQPTLRASTQRTGRHASYGTASSRSSDAGVPIEKIARLVGHTGTATTETVYRKQIRPVVVGGAEVMDGLFPRRDTDA
jgi:integrase